MRQVSSPPGLGSALHCTALFAAAAAGGGDLHAHHSKWGLPCPACLLAARRPAYLPSSCTDPCPHPPPPCRCAPGTYCGAHRGSGSPCYLTKWRRIQ